MSTEIWKDQAEHHFPWRLKLAAASRDSLWLAEMKCCTSGDNRSPFPLLEVFRNMSFMTSSSGVVSRRGANEQEPSRQDVNPTNATQRQKGRHIHPVHCLEGAQCYPGWQRRVTVAHSTLLGLWQTAIVNQNTLLPSVDSSRKPSFRWCLELTCG